MFYPYQKKENILLNGSYCKNFNYERLLWSKKETVFWKQGFKILQNIDDRMTLSSQVRRLPDPVTLKISQEEAGIPSKQLEDPEKVDTNDVLPDISQFPGFLWYIVYLSSVFFYDMFYINVII